MRQGKAATVFMRNPRYLNAEDEATLQQTEIAVDLAILDPKSELCVLRGDVVDNPKYAGKRVFSTGINLTHIYHGKISYMWYVTREMGFVNKMMRGLARPDVSPDEVYGGTTEKPWIAGVEHFAIGGGCQYLLTMDYVVAASNAYMTLPARKEGIIPGAANMRMWRFTGDKIARQAIMSGRRLDCDTPEGRTICDEIVPPGEMDAALDPRDRELHRFRRRQRGGQPARVSRRRGAARPVPPLHGGVRARAGLLPFQSGADRQSGKALERAAEEDVVRCHPGSRKQASLRSLRTLGCGRLSGIHNHRLVHNRTARGYGFRARDFVAPRNDGERE